MSENNVSMSNVGRIANVSGRGVGYTYVPSRPARCRYGANGFGHNPECPCFREQLFEKARADWAEFQNLVEGV